MSVLKLVVSIMFLIFSPNEISILSWDVLSSISHFIFKMWSLL